MTVKYRGMIVMVLFSKSREKKWEILTFSVRAFSAKELHAMITIPIASTATATVAMVCFEDNLLHKHPVKNNNINYQAVKSRPVSQA